MTLLLQIRRACLSSLLACAALDVAGGWDGPEPQPPAVQPPAVQPPEALVSATGEFAFQNGELVSYLPESFPLQRSGAVRRDEAGPRSLFEEQQPLAGTPAAESALSEGIDINHPLSTAQVLQETPDIQTVNIQRRSSIAFDPRVRGYHLGQVFSQGEGAWLFPVRPDLDAALSKTDPLLIDRLDVISGPYTVRNGPGFAFIDIDLADSPRFSQGYEIHNRSGYTIRANGGQHYLVDTVWGGNADYGFLLNYTYRQGASYFAGNGQRIPSAYLANNVSAQFGVDLASGAKLELRYDFLDQGFTQYPGQFFNVTNLQTNAFLVSLTDAEIGQSWTQMRLDAWHYRTPSSGVVSNDPIFQIKNRVQTALENFLPGPAAVNFNGTTDSQILVSGGRGEFLFGDPDYVTLRTGADVRHQRQFIREQFPVIVGPPDPPGPPLDDFLVSTELPNAELFNPGLYASLAAPLTSFWTGRLGARVDYVHTTARPRPGSQIDPNFRTRDDALYAFFLMNDLKLTDTATATIGFGQAQRPPTLVERYADGVFISVLQSGLSRVVGNPRLNPERLWQFDAGLSVDNGNFRGGLNFFYSWIQDYITYEGALVLDPTGARLLHYTPTPLATLTGFEFKGEEDLSSSTTAFLTSHLVQGQDETLGVPLWGISPLEGQVGLRWHDPDAPQERGMDLLVRMVATQKRIGVIRGVPPPNQPAVNIPIEQVTPTFAYVNLRGYWNPAGTRLRMVAGIDNLLNSTYLQHLDLRLPASPAGFPAAFAYSPGITPYVTVDWTY